MSLKDLVRNDVLTDNYASEAEAKAALAKAGVGEVKVVVNDTPDGKKEVWKHVIPFEKLVVSEEHTLSEVELIADTYGKDWVAKVINSGMDLEARREKRANLKSSEGKAVSRATKEESIMRLVIAGSKPWAEKLMSIIGDPKAKAKFLDSLALEDIK